MSRMAVYAYDDGSGYWAVEHINEGDDGLVEKAIFTGPNAERQARDFARAEYAQVRSPQHQPA